MNFKDWLKNNYRKKDGSKLSERSIQHYISGLSAISTEMYNLGVINKKIEDMTIFELDKAYYKIFDNNDFIDKNNKGNNMYSNSLKRYRCYKYFESSENGEVDLDEYIEEIIKDKKVIDKTERESIVKSRVGQGIYRKRIMSEYNGKCIVTEINISQALIASHIKPWAVCTNEERLSQNNGLMLSATIDKLFDSGLITFTNKGKIIFSSLISNENKKRLNLDENKLYELKLNKEKESYLDYHNKIVFVN